MDLNQQSVDFSELFDASASPIIVLDAQLVIRACNKAYEALINTKREDLLNRPAFDVLSSGNPEQDEALLQSFN
ncbi:PAS domain-containing protein [Pseudidiomarina sp. GXY010]|uniref:PAS domain-containing protein n=1 Tax=Pseudidiomarina fusca TaxID=2965078 RepID=A0ABU3L0Q2_9GAMM|nr:PAS domain-containing protein [Pseudidiomarina sp. GXY010]MDT7526711.1 PAS domain-containing protein [Pseudidiomarina sp. GXY010]